MHTQAPPTALPRNAREELARLVHGPCEPAFLDSLRGLLAADPAPAVPDPARRGARLARRMRRLSEGLAPAGGLHQDPARLAALHAWIMVSEPALCLTACVHYLLCLGSIVQLAGEPGELKEQVEALESGRARGAYMITEAGAANSHLAVRTRACFDPVRREFVLRTPDTAAAKFAGVGAPGVAQTAVVLARLFVAEADCGVFAFVVDISDADGLLPGIEMSGPIELSAIPLDYAQVRFHGIHLPYERWLRDSARISDQGVFHDPLGSVDGRLQRTLCVGQGLWATLPSVAAAAARQSAVLALGYARQRRTQGRLAPGVPLLEYRTQQHALLGALADAFALTCAADQARTLWAESLAPATGTPELPETGMAFGPWAAVSRPLAGYKAWSVREAARVTADCQRHCGFSGHLDVNRLAAYQGFFHAFDTAGGDSQLILYDLGRALVDDTGPGPDPAVPGPASPSPSHSPDDPRWWPGVIRAHQRALNDRLRRARDQGQGPAATEFELWNPLLEQAGTLAQAYTERLAADDITAAVDRLRNDELRTPLLLLGLLHGALAARRWAGSLLTTGTLRPVDAAELPGTVDALCDALLPYLPLLTDCFSYPAEVVPAPMAAADGDRTPADGRHGGRS